MRLTERAKTILTILVCLPFLILLAVSLAAWFAPS